RQPGTAAASKEEIRQSAEPRPAQSQQAEQDGGEHRAKVGEVPQQVEAEIPVIPAASFLAPRRKGSRDSILAIQFTSLTIRNTVKVYDEVHDVAAGVDSQGVGENVFAGDVAMACATPVLRVDHVCRREYSAREVERREMTTD